MLARPPVCVSLLGDLDGLLLVDALQHAFFEDGPGPGGLAGAIALVVAGSCDRPRWNITKALR